MPLSLAHRRLGHGLEVIAEVRPDAHTAAVGFFVQAGSRDETPELMGVSHFLEHMMFKGTERRSADDINRAFDAIGADYNAFTSQEMTVYFARLIPEHLPAAVELFSDMLQPSLRAADFEMEQKVILEEIGMYEDQPAWRLQDALLEQAFSRHPLGQRVLGTPETVGALTPEQMRGYFEARYGADRITVAAAGAVDFDALCADLETRTAGWAASGADRDPGHPVLEPGDATLEDPSLTRHYMAMLFPAPALQDPARRAARVLAEILGGEGGSRLFWSLVDPGLADDVEFAYVPYDRAGVYLAFASCDPERAGEVETVLRRTLEAARDGLEPDEVTRAVGKLGTGLALQAENPQGRMVEIGSRWAVLGEYETPDEALEHYQTIGSPDLEHLARDAFRDPAVLRLTPGA